MALAFLATCTIAVLTACGTAGSVGSSSPRLGTTARPGDVAAPTPEEVADQARAVPGIDGVSLRYVDPDGHEHEALPYDPGDRADWTALIYITHDLHRSTGWMAKTVASLVGDRPSSSPRLEIRLTPTADGSSTLDVAAVPPRPPHVVPEQWPDDPAAPECSPDDLLLTIAGHDAATGHRAMIVAATNTGDAACAVEGYPELAFRTLDEQSLDVTVTPGSSFMARDPGAERVVIPPDARALAVAGWNAMSTAEYPEGSGNWPDVTAEILLAIGPGTEAVELPLTSWVLTPEQDRTADLGDWRPITTLDILDGGEVEVTAWAPEGAPF